MARRVFYSFHFDQDNWRAGQVRSMGVIGGNSPVSDNDWETVKRGGDPAIERWIAGQLEGTSCTIVLIGSQTAGRKWINHEITQSWNRGNGVLGIHIHCLKDRNGWPSTMGRNPFVDFKLDGAPLSSIVNAYLPPFVDSQDVYAFIAKNMASWVEHAIAIRSQH